MRPPLDLSVYLVTDTALCAEIGVAATVTAAVAAGASVVQVRDPTCADAEFVALGRSVATVLLGT
ncbi:MAG TPA: thiamine phosphate synthase, partial [Nakamurella sp.]